MFHRTNRLLLRPIWPEDWQAIHIAIADNGVVRNLARAPWPYREEHAREFAQLSVEPNFPRFLITRARDAALIGCIGLDEHDRGAELGYWIARPFWGQGFATEAACGVLEVAAMLGHKRIVAGHFLDNPASGRVLRKLGFEPTGIVRERHSCGRGEAAPAAEYSLELERDMPCLPQAA